MRKVSKSAQIRALIDKGLSGKEIVKKLKVSPQLVYLVTRNYVGKSTVKRTSEAKNKDRAVLEKLWSILNKYRNAA